MHSSSKTLPTDKANSWKMFDRISHRYDFLNHFLSFGLDISWRKQLSGRLPAQAEQTVLDLATGTGDVLLTLFKRSKNVTRGYGIDLSERMLDLGRKKVENAGLSSRILLQHGDANRIPYSDNNFNAVTIAFGLRNIDNPVNVLKEILRVLKPEGRALILEFSLPGNPLVRGLHLFYLRNIVPFAGGIFSGESKAYRYLNQTIEEFPYGEHFCRIFSQAGFKNVRATALLFGVATIYQGDK